jgi:excisionase family DNA binding protein
MMETNNEKRSDRVYTLSELLDILQVTRRTLLNYIRRGKLKAFKVGNTWRVTQKQLDDFIESNMK